MYEEKLICRKYLTERMDQHLTAKLRGPFKEEPPPTHTASWLMPWQDGKLGHTFDLKHVFFLMFLGLNILLHLVQLHLSRSHFSFLNNKSILLGR